MLQDGWKLIEWFEDGAIELFYLPNDPSEKVNLATEQVARVAELRQRLQLWQANVQAKKTSANPGWDPQKPSGRR